MITSIIHIHMMILAMKSSMTIINMAGMMTIIENRIEIIMGIMIIEDMEEIEIEIIG